MSKDLSAGSGREVAVLEDTNSSVIKEVVSQLNQSELPILKSFLAVADAATVRIPIGIWRHDAWVRDIFFTNDNAANDLVDADTDVALVKYAAGAIDLTVAGTYLFRVEGFDGGAFPAKTNLFASAFVAGVNCTAVSGNPNGIFVKAGEMLVLEFINNEGAARNLIVGVTMVMTDFLKLFSAHLAEGEDTPDRALNFMPGRQYHVAAPYKQATGQNVLVEQTGQYFRTKARTQ